VFARTPLKGFQLDAGPQAAPLMKMVWLRGRFEGTEVFGPAVAAGAAVAGATVAAGGMVAAGAMVAGAAVGVAAGAQAHSTMLRAMTTDKTGSSLRILVLLFWKKVVWQDCQHKGVSVIRLSLLHLLERMESAAIHRSALGQEKEERGGIDSSVSLPPRRAAGFADHQLGVQDKTAGRLNAVLDQVDQEFDGFDSELNNGLANGS